MTNWAPPSSSFSSSSSIGLVGGANVTSATYPIDDPLVPCVP